MAYINGNKVFTLMRTETEPIDVPNSQATTTLVKNANTNINGWVLTNFTATLTTISGYSCYQIQYNNENLDEEKASLYMECMTGSKFVPKYDFNKPQNSFFIFGDYTFWKPQFDETNGLLLYYVGRTTSYNDMKYLTTAPTSDNTSEILKFVVLDSEPATYYDGYYYIITESQNNNGGGSN